MSPAEELYKFYLKSSGITTDSRHIKEGSVFFALKGEHFDGNQYAADALEKGAGLAVVDNKEVAKGSGFFLVENVLKSLQELAAYHRQTLDIPIIGLSGTNGKTTTKELIRQVLATKYRTLATIGNLNNHIGVPLTLLNIDKDAEVAVVEMGANHIGEIAMLCSLAKPTHGMITNIGIAHLEGFGSYEGVTKAKSELFAHLQKVKGKAYVNYNDSLLMGLSSALLRSTYGNSDQADVYGSITNSAPFLEIIWGSREIKTHLYGDYNFENIMAAICIGNEFGVDAEKACSAIASYIPTNNRSQVVIRGSNTIFLDAYNANPSSMMASIRQFDRQAGKKKVLILGDMLELGGASQEEHGKVLAEIEGNFDTVILVGPEFSAISPAGTITVFKDTDDAASWLKMNPVEGAHILIKGSRGIALEKLLDLL